MRFAGVIALSLAMTAPASAGFFDFLFGDDSSGAGQTSRQSQDSRIPNPFEPARPPAAPAAPLASDGGAVRSNFTHCVRMCDGKHFPLLNRGGSSPVAMCQAFCPASDAKVFFGSNIDRAISMDGERYSELKTAYAYRTALRADCTCNGRDPAGLAPVDLSMDTTLRNGDIIATATGLVAFSGSRNSVRGGDFTPVASFPGLTAEARARLGEMKVMPISAEVEDDYTASTNAGFITGSE